MRRWIRRWLAGPNRQIAGDNSVQIMGDNISMTFYDEPAETCTHYECEYGPLEECRYWRVRDGR
jgi:hypothetical protein